MRREAAISRSWKGKAPISRVQQGKRQEGLMNFEFMSRSLTYTALRLVLDPSEQQRKSTMSCTFVPSRNRPLHKCGSGCQTPLLARACRQQVLCIPFLTCDTTRPPNCPSKWRHRHLPRTASCRQRASATTFLPAPSKDPLTTPVSFWPLSTVAAKSP